jgi:hypothetical protein
LKFDFGDHQDSAQAASKDVTSSSLCLHVGAEQREAVWHAFAAFCYFGIEGSAVLQVVLPMAILRHVIPYIRSKNNFQQAHTALQTCDRMGPFASGNIVSNVFTPCCMRKWLMTLLINRACMLPQVIRRRCSMQITQFFMLGMPTVDDWRASVEVRIDGALSNCGSAGFASASSSRGTTLIELSHGAGAKELLPKTH